MRSIQLVKEVAHNGICFTYGSKHTKLHSHIVSLVSDISDDVIFVTIITDDMTYRQSHYIELQEILAEKLECSNMVQRMWNKTTTSDIILTTNVESLLKLLSRKERTKLLFDEDVRIRNWIKELSL